ncbi:MAG: hypothetical protein IPF44_03135 [Betaproteobacteria bacterium]|nr:hypothetical protein [Betaproteobacteria bacterium]
MVRYPGLFVISSIDNFVKPILIARGAGLSILLIALGVLGGVLVFGFIGIFMAQSCWRSATRCCCSAGFVERNSTGMIETDKLGPGTIAPRSTGIIAPNSKSGAGRGARTRPNGHQSAPDLRSGA